MREYSYLKRIILFTFILNLVESDEKSLFTEADHITVFDLDNFASKVYNQKKAFLVEFYSSWCGACIAYAPIYKQFAATVREWKAVVEVGAVNCAEDKNVALCREHAIDAFPTIKYFKYDSKEKSDASKFNGEKYDMAVFPLEVAQLVRDDWLKQKPVEWPNFDYASNKSTVDSLWQSADPAAKLLVLIVESFKPRNAWADMINFWSDKRVSVNLLSSGDELAKSLGATPSDLPLAYIYTKGKQQPIFKSDAKVTWADIKEKVQEQLIALGGAPKPVEPKPPAGDGDRDVNPKVKVTWSQFQVELLDMTSALSHILYSEIPRRQSIEGENLDGLKKFINMLKKYAPGTLPIRRLFYRLEQWLSPMTQVSSEQWLAEVELVQADLGYPIPKNMTFLACRGSQPYLRGYSCGLWTLLHTITVEAAKSEQNNHSFNAVDEIVEPIHQFIWRFFGCEECGRHFHSHVLKTDKASLRTAGDTVMWLWRTHNIVNKLLAGTTSDDPAFPKQQFPPALLCPTCRKPDGAFVDSEVQPFLTRYYSDIKTNTAEQAPAYKVSEFEGGKLKNTETKRFNPKFAVGADRVDQLEEAEQRLRRENVDANPQRRWKNIDSADMVKPYDASSGSRFFYVLWLFIASIVVFFVYTKYRRNRTKFWKTFYYYNDYKLCPFSSHSHQNARKFAV